MSILEEPSKRVRGAEFAQHRTSSARRLVRGPQYSRTKMGQPRFSAISAVAALDLSGRMTQRIYGGRVLTSEIAEPSQDLERIGSDFHEAVSIVEVRRSNRDR